MITVPVEFIEEWFSVQFAKLKAFWTENVSQKLSNISLSLEQF